MQKVNTLCTLPYSRMHLCGRAALVVHQIGTWDQYDRDVDPQMDRDFYAYKFPFLFRRFRPILINSQNINFYYYLRSRGLIKQLYM